MGVGTGRRGAGNFPPQRLYATVYQPGPDDPSEFDQEAHDHWARLFAHAGLDPAVHIVNGNKKDNFWMMGDTGPCGPCSELHVDLTPARRHAAARSSTQAIARCIEIWNLVFIQFNANPDGTFSPLPAASRRYRHGLRARHRDHPRHEKFHRFHRHDLELRNRHLPPDLRRDRKTERQEDTASTLPQAWQQPATPNRRKSTSPSASSPTTSAPSASRSPTASSRATKDATTSCAASCAARSATAARSVSRTVLLQAGRRPRPHDGRCLPRAPRRSRSRSRK